MNLFPTCFNNRVRIGVLSQMVKPILKLARNLFIGFSTGFVYCQCHERHQFSVRQPPPALGSETPIVIKTFFFKQMHFNCLIMARNAFYSVNSQTVGLSKTLVFGMQVLSLLMPAVCLLPQTPPWKFTLKSNLNKMYCTWVKCVATTDYLWPVFNPNHGLCIFSLFGIFSVITVWVTETITSADISYPHSGCF